MFPNSPAYLSDCASVHEEPDAKWKRHEADQLQKVIQMSLFSHEGEERKYKKLQRHSNAQLFARLTQRKLPRHWVKRSPAYAQKRSLTNCGKNSVNCHADQTEGASGDKACKTAKKVQVHREAI
ncbi:hypothetical protein HPB52_004400 [Rhipicephalus sanguineus]|uniref:Uncharacterized protein n=1 Tax=Rhipicephalus sanguineus TaxID=34632 RepID=A0A9D4Q476_RHISA|nr:hypothetical protein HPB52_004400 [Rhipicephalus sanguineus]